DLVWRSSRGGRQGRRRGPEGREEGREEGRQEGREVDREEGREDRGEGEVNRFSGDPAVRGARRFGARASLFVGGSNFPDFCGTALAVVPFSCAGVGPGQKTQEFQMIRSIAAALAAFVLVSFGV